MLTLAFLLTTQAFQPEAAIPSKYTCDGLDISPSITWSNLPEHTKSLALIVDDPDARDPDDPKMTNYVHWVLYNIPPTAEGLPENVKSDNLPIGTQQGKNDWGKTGYGGPCPPSDNHRYYFKLYALDTILPNLEQPTKAQLEKAINGHIISTTELMGTYTRKK